MKYYLNQNKSLSYIEFDQHKIEEKHFVSFSDNQVNLEQDITEIKYS